MIKKVKILGVAIDNVGMDEVLERIGVLAEDGSQHYIVTPNSEFLVLAQKNPGFKQILSKADLAVPDGISLIFASWFLGQPLRQRVVGVDLMERVCQEAVFKNWPIFLLGGKEGVSSQAAFNLAEKYPGLEIKGLDNRGVDDIQFLLSSLSSGVNKRPSILFLALGTPKQEKWIFENLKKIEAVRLAIGVGGAFDFLAGRVSRAPRILRSIGLEWLWRLACQPWRIKRVFKAVIVFPCLVIYRRLVSIFSN